MMFSSDWHIYIVLCQDGTLYTGITKNLERRIAEHNSDQGGAKYTRSRKPVKLVYTEPAASRATAARREYQLKKMSLAQKRALIKTTVNLRF